MFSPRYKARWANEADLAAEMLMRGRVRRALRTWCPDIPKVSGSDWLFAESGIPCPLCPAAYRHVRVPGVDLPDLLACPNCGNVSLHFVGS